jgi:dihydrofolate reductase
MRKLKLQTQVSLDGYIAGPNGEMDWMTWNWDDELKKFVTRLTKPVDCILLGRAIAEGFISTWAERAKEPGADWFTHKMVDTYKVVFSKTLKSSEWPDTRLANGDIVEEINQLKKQSGKDIIAYGGANFVSSLIKHRLIDEYYFFVNPAIIGEGMPIFKEVGERLNLKLIKASGFECGIVVLNYQNA